MIEFIILGHVPGTDIYLSFETIAPVLAVVAAVFSKTILGRLKYKLKQRRIKSAAI